jgi:hypothetical protein
LEPLLDLLEARYGKYKPLSELSGLQEAIHKKLVEIKQKKQVMIDQLAAEGKTIEVDAIRRRLERSKTAYSGDDRDNYAREVDRFLETLTTRYGERIPVDEAYAIQQTLEGNLEGP